MELCENPLTITGSNKEEGESLKISQCGMLMVKVSHYGTNTK
jgi:hypothetical protein